MTKLTLVSSPTCPFVQRAIIALREKGAEFDVQYVDLANKPDWFLAISPLGKVPLLRVQPEGEPETVLFESSVICEYLDETVPGLKLHPADPLQRAKHRGWMEYGSAVLADLWKFTSAKDEAELSAARSGLAAKFKRVEESLGEGPFFPGSHFSFVDAVFGPVFRQIDTLDAVTDTDLLAGLPRAAAWRQALAARPSVRAAVPGNYAELFLAGMRNRGSVLLRADA